VDYIHTAKKLPDERKKFARFEQLYKKHESALKLHGFAPSTIDCYARALRRVTEFAFASCCPDKLTKTQLQRNENRFEQRLVNMRVAQQVFAPRGFRSR
jgi:hypothetical protein